VHYRHSRHSWIHSHCFARFGVAIVQCNYFRPRSIAATFAVDAIVAAAVADADFESVVVDVNWAVASKAFVDLD